MTDSKHEEPGRWRTFGERSIYDSPWVQLGQIDVELPDGGRYWHHVVRLPRTAMLALVDDQDRVLLLWRYRLVQDKWGWEIPGGLVDEDEQPADAVRRDLEEATGYRAGSIEHLITFQLMEVDAEHMIFVARNPERIGEPNAVNEISRVEWVPLTSVSHLIASGDVWDAGSLVALLRLLLMRAGVAE